MGVHAWAGWLDSGSVNGDSPGMYAAPFGRLKVMSTRMERPPRRTW